MKPIEGYHLVTPDALEWKVANPMKVPYADLLEASNSEMMSARLWRLPAKSANTWHKHVKAEEFYFVLEGTGRIRIADETLTVAKHCGVLVGPDMMRQIFNDTDEDVLWLIIAAPENEFGPHEKFDLKLFWPEDPKNSRANSLAPTGRPPKPKIPQGSKCINASGGCAGICNFKNGFPAAT